MTLASVDVDYRDAFAVAGCVLFSHWQAEASDAELTAVVSPVAPYVPGELYRRELPPILEVLAKAAEAPEVVLVDGYVWLGDETRPGLGAHLFHALSETTPVVGVAKSLFAGAGPARAVFRGASRRPLYVSAAGMDLDAAARHVAEMHGDHRLPTMLRRADRLCRSSITR